MPHENKDRFVPSMLIYIYFIIVSCLISLARPLKMILSGNGDRGHTRFSLLNIMVPVGFS